MSCTLVRSAFHLVLTLSLVWLLLGAGGAGAVDAERASASDPLAIPTEPVPAASEVESAPLEPSIPAATGLIAEENLANILSARRQIEAELRERQAELRSDRARGREQELENAIRELSKSLAALDRNFSELSTGVDPLALDSDPAPGNLSLSGEVRDLLSPLVNELKRATSRPREIDRLRTQIGQLGERLERNDLALSRLEVLRPTIQDAAVLAALDAETAAWQRRESALRTSLQVARQKLDQRLGESQSIRETIENVFEIFFKSRGRNLLIAFLATFAYLLLSRRMRAFLATRPSFSRRSDSFSGRIIGLVYSVLTFVGALLVFLLVLYFFGDWVLLILVLLLILGIIWTSKQAVPRFWSQTVLILDMGPVREGERVWHAGLPWQVETISFYTTLTNPSLVGGTIRLPIADLSSMRSRPLEEEEPWFPTRAGDVILLEDGRPAEVEFQSIEVVRLRTPGENRLIVPASEFSGSRIERLSDGYRVDLTFGLDYAEQAGITTRVRETLERGIRDRWQTTPWADFAVSLGVEFQEAGASSLDLYVRIDLDGRAAFEIMKQKRALAGFCVDVCNEEGWVIPFTQLTLHVAGNEAGSPSPSNPPSKD